MSRKTIAFFATIKTSHRFWDLTRAGSVIKVEVDNFPEWEENGYQFKIAQN